MMTPEDRQKLRATALMAMNAVRARVRDTNALFPSDWKLQTSNSFRRIGAHGDGDVLCGTKHPIDGQPDLLGAPGVLDYMIAAQPRVLIQLLDDVAALEDKLEKASAVTHKIEDVERRLRDMASGLVALGGAFTKLVDAAGDEREWALAAEKVHNVLAQLNIHLVEMVL